MARTKHSTVPDPPHCFWTLDDDDHGESWDTRCKNKFQFTEGGPVENGMKYCCYCGRILKAFAADRSQEKP